MFFRGFRIVREREGKVKISDIITQNIFSYNKKIVILFIIYTSINSPINRNFKNGIRN